MRRSRKPITIAARGSHLSQAQARLVGAMLSSLRPAIEVEYRWVQSEGDQLPEAELASRGGKGLFVRAVERQLMSDQAEVAVHSMKDMPSSPREAMPSLSVAAVPRRADARDVLVCREPSHRSLADLPPNASLATSSPRRAAQVLMRRPDLRIVPLRGNIDTRLRKIRQERLYDATILAAAGLERAGLLEASGRCYLSTDDMLPAAGQGALAVQVRAADHVTLWRVLQINDPFTAQCVHAERQVVAALGGDCHSPIAAHAQPVEIDGRPGIRLRARVLSSDGRRCLHSDRQAPVKRIKPLIKSVLDDLVAAGAGEVLAAALPTI